MSIVQARQIAINVVHLAELAARFQAKYGRNYVVKPDSPQDAVSLYEEILSQQALIAGMLSPEALDVAYHRFGNWWSRHDVIDSAIVNELVMDACNLVSRAGYIEETNPRETQSLLPIQKSIAGMLHPNAREMAREAAFTHREAS
ncbi:hypothetical protein G4Y79_07440 [Phototrophicus methaneseepsis]|uniref:Uncharacterized protein n=1 Tax=Phototrophicus methaneseepsis TaxID=2710758 RepID=A0A7S8EC29_9CHLR|nr:hypothetical protein [Phototrophicus methaneseepsis]QPC84197.1 hypothetical protein G4Y79_07440 [Phototrophicus methaneseepsis]